MNILFNSDVFHHGTIITDRFSPGWERLFSVCAEKNHTISVPETTLLEFQKLQNDLIEGEIKSLESSYKNLDKYNIKYRRKEPSRIIKICDPIKIIRDIGVKVEIIKPSKTIYNQAHRRACLHLSPVPQKGKGNEMRDTIIWLTALQIANKSGEALLISRDKVHTGNMGDIEAYDAGLIRVNGVEAALEYFDLLTPAGIEAKRYIELAWDYIINEINDLKTKPSIISIKKVVFTQGLYGISRVKCFTKMQSKDNEDISCDMEINIHNMIITKITMKNITKNKDEIKSEIIVDTDIKLNISDDFVDRYTEFTKTIRS